MNLSIEKFSDKIQSISDEMVDISKQIWRHPQTGYQETFACNILCDFLEKNGFSVQCGVEDMDTAFIAKKGSGTINVFYPVEYDALPGLGHACGHNLFCVSGAAAGIALAENLADEDVTVTVVGCPAEEGACVDKGSSKVRLCELGVFDDADVAFICHGDGNAVVERKLVAGCNLSVHFKGRPSHAGGSPEKGINALTAGMLTINNINALRQHFIFGDRINPVITESSDITNTIPEMCNMKINMRAFEKNELYSLIEKVKKCVEAASLVTGCTYETDFASYPTEDVMPNHVLGLECGELMKKLGISPKENDMRSYSWDIGNVTHKCPTLAAYYKIGPDTLVGHTPEFREASNSDEAYKAMVDASSIITYLGAKFVLDEKFRNDADKEFMNNK